MGKGFLSLKIMAIKSEIHMHVYMYFSFMQYGFWRSHRDTAFFFFIRHACSKHDLPKEIQKSNHCKTPAEN